MQRKKTFLVVCLSIPMMAVNGQTVSPGPVDKFVEKAPYWRLRAARAC